MTITFRDRAPTSQVSRVTEELRRSLHTMSMGHSDYSFRAGRSSQCELRGVRGGARQEADPENAVQLDSCVTAANSFLLLNVVCRCSSTVEHLICNQVVASSILAIGLVGTIALGGEVPEWPKGADCKSAGLCLRRFESSPLHQYNDEFDGESGNSSVGRARAFQARGRGFESRFPLQNFGTTEASEFFANRFVY